MSHSQSQTNQPKLCLICKDMYGHPDFKDMCSKCFKQFKAKKQPTECEQLTLLKKQTQHGPQQSLQNESLKNQEASLKIEKKEEKFVTPLSKCQELEKQQKEQKGKKDKSRCRNCNKKVGMLGYECKHCMQMFCKLHRLPEQHECEVDFISLGKKKLEQQNPVVQVMKIQKI